jgi:four helix bundle protein
VGKQFEDLKVYQDALRISVELYKLALSADFKKDYSFCDQFKRSLLSITSNIAEGFERNNNKELRRFPMFAKGSAGEARSQMIFGSKLGYFSKEQADHYVPELLQLCMQLKGFVKYIQNWNNNSKPDTASVF